MPKLPRNARAKNQNTKTNVRQGRPSWKGLKLSDLKDIVTKMKDRFKWGHSPREFQADATKAQLMRQDVLIHAGTGSGKTAVVAGPFAHEATEGMVTFLVSPLIALQEEQAKTFQEEFKLTSTAINSARGGCSLEVMKDICSGKWQVVVLSPEMMLSKRFISNVLRNPEMSQRILSIVVDEAHVVSHWGSGFRKKYGTLGILRALIPKGTPIVAMSATLPARVRNDVLTKLQFDKENYLSLNLGNDRSNVSLVVRAIHNPMNTYSDLDFLIPENIQQIQDIKKVFIYADNVNTGAEMMDHLYSLLPEEYRLEAGVIRNYNAVYSSKGRSDVLELFKAGFVRILICTDAAGMGCNIPDIDIVVQWKLPATLSSFVQRAGRAARANGRSGLAVLLVEPSVYDSNLFQVALDEARRVPENEPVTKGKAAKKTKQANDKASAKKGSVRGAAKYPKAENKQYAIGRGLLRGKHDGKTDTCAETFDVPIDFASIDEGLYAFVQTTVCRRRVLTLVYDNDRPDPVVPCCDLCCPSLLDQTRPSPPPRKQRASALKIGMPNQEVMRAMVIWRKEIWRRDFADAMFGPSIILSDEAIENLSSVGPVQSLLVLERALGGHWAWFEKYGDELLAKLASLSIPPLKPKLPKESSKRAREGGEGSDGNGSMNAGGKRKRTTATAATPKPSSSTSIPTPTTVNRGASRTHPPLRHPPSTPIRTPISTAVPIQHGYPHAQYVTPLHNPLPGNPYAGHLTPSPHTHFTPQQAYFNPFMQQYMYYNPGPSPSGSQQAPPFNPQYYMPPNAGWPPPR